MTAAAALKKPIHQLVNPLAVFELRCDVRAYLVRHDEMDLQEAVDGLQISAAEAGLVDRLGQNMVQNMIARAFEESPEC